MDVNTYGCIQALTQERSIWEPEQIQIMTLDGTEVNLMDYIGEGPLKKGTTFFLPVDAPQIQAVDPTPAAKLIANKTNKDNRKKVVQYVCEACASAGFPIVNESWDSRDERINVVCDRGVLYDPTKSKGIRKTKTNRPTRKGDLCPFRFNIHWFEDKKCWGIKAGLGMRCHKGHVCLDKENVKILGTRCIPSHAFEFCIDSLASNAPPSTVKALVKQRYNVTVSSAQIEYWARLANPQRGEQSSAASSLLQSLKDAGDISYVALYDDPSSTLLRVRKPTKADEIRLRSALHRSDGAEPTVVSEGDLQSNPKTMEYVEKVLRDSMCLNDGQRMLLALAWTSNKARCLGSQNAEVLAADVTEQTNCEKRPLMMLAGLTGNNETFTLCQAFLPSQQRWVLDWFFRTAVPFLLAPGTLTRNRMMLTDGDEKEYNSFLSALDEHYPNSRHHLCTWHLLDRGLRNTPLLKLCSEKTMCNDGVVAFKSIKLWIQSWFTTLETEQEYNHSYSKLLEWMGSEEVINCMGTDVTSRIIGFIHGSITPHKNKWLFALFLYRRTFERQSTQIVEVENSVIKRAPNGPKPFHKIDKAARNMILLQDCRNSEKSKRAASALSKRRTTSVSNDIDVVLTDYCVERLLQQSACRDEYDVYRQSESSFLVKRKSAQNPPANEKFSLDPKAGCPEQLELNEKKMWYFVPQYIRTRIVSISEVSGEQYLRCSCGLFERLGFPCRHIYAVLNRDPMPYDVIPRYHKAFESFYQIDKAYTDYYDVLLQNELPGPPMEGSALLQMEISAFIPPAILASTPDQPPVVRIACKWWVEENNTTVTDDNANSRLQQEFSLSQHAASGLCDDGGSGGDDGSEDYAIIDNVVESPMNEEFVGEDADANADNMGIAAMDADANNMDNINLNDVLDEITAVAEDALKVTAISQNTSRQASFHQRYGPTFQEYCKMSEWGPAYDAMMGSILMKGMELTRRAYAEDQKKRCRVSVNMGGANEVVSSHMEARGPKKAKRLKPIGSPSRM
jgi:MULE transposase domain/SWIM zinc finger